MPIDYLALSPLDPEYTSVEAQTARLQHLIEYVRQHAPDDELEAFLLARLAAVNNERTQ